MRHIWLGCFAIGLILTPFSARATAQAAADTYVSDLGRGLDDSSKFVADTFARSLGFTAGLGRLAPPAAHGLLGFDLSVGALAGFTRLDKAGLLNAAANNAFDAKAYAASLPDTLPLPLGLISAHLGLTRLLFFESVDVGLRYGALDLSDSGSGAALNFSLWGAEIRGNLFEAGLVSPATLTLGLAFDQMSASAAYSSSLASASGSYAGYAFSGTQGFDTQLNAKVQVVSLQASVSRKFIFITPYFGLVGQVASGDAQFSTADTGSVTFQGAPNSNATGRVEGRASVPVAPYEAKLGGGFSLGLGLLGIHLGAEYGLISGSYGGQAQIGLAFH